VHHKPEISVIVPCYKQAEYLDECIASVIEQTFQNWECIIVDDGSPDNTETISKKWCEKDSRIKYYKKINEGVSIARNYGIEYAEGEFILPLDADDKIGKQYMELALPYFKTKENVKIVYSKAAYFGEVTGLWKLLDYSFETILTENMIINSSFFLKSEWKRIGGYDKNMVEGLEDWEFWINMLSNGGEVIKIDSIQYYHREKEKSRNIEARAYSEKLGNYICEKHISSYNSNIGNHIKLFNKINETKNTKEYRLGKILLLLPRIFLTFVRIHILKRKY
jgi:glycosyltransferase involved in cell wall biosynthesis